MLWKDMKEVALLTRKPPFTQASILSSRGSTSNSSFRFNPCPSCGISSTGPGCIAHSWLYQLAVVMQVPWSSLALSQCRTQSVQTYTRKERALPVHTTMLYRA